MKFNFMVIFISVTSMAYAMEKCNGNENGHSCVKVAQKDLQSIMNTLEELKGQQAEIQKTLAKKAEQETVAQLEKDHKTVADLLQDLYLNLQPNMQEPITEQSNGDDVSRPENNMLWFSGGFLAGSLPFLISYALIK